jgi:hypothetical protein
MTKFESFLKSNDLEGTATNKYGETVYLGKAHTLKHTKYAYNILWDAPKTEQVSPFDRIILHSKDRIFGVLDMPPFILAGYTKVQVTVK